MVATIKSSKITLETLVLYMYIQLWHIEASQLNYSAIPVSNWTVLAKYDGEVNELDIKDTFKIMI